MAKAAKKTAKKSASRKASASASASANLPQSDKIPEGMKQVGGGYAPTWKPTEPGEVLHGIVSDQVRTVEIKQGRKKDERRVFELTDNATGDRYAVWESAALGDLFDIVTERGVGTEVFIQFDGLGKKKAGQNPPKLFTVAVAE